MSEPLRAVIVTHAEMGEALLHAAKAIVGQVDGVTAISNDGCGTEALGERILAAVNRTPTVVFVDLPGGSCFQAAARQMHGQENVAVVAGVNLAMLLDFLYHRDVSPAEAAARAVDAGSRAIRQLPR
jgi:mannose/fructose-specific phosphotransferase system component IIA